MTLNKKNLLIFSILGMIVSYYFYNTRLSDQNVQEQEENQILIKGTLALKRLWEEGDSRNKFRSGEESCPSILGDLKGVYANYLKCNPQFIECYLNNKKNQPHIIVSHKRKKYEINLTRSFLIPGTRNKKGYYRVITKSNSNDELTPDYGILLELKLLNSKLKSKQRIILEDSCGDTYLPQRVYGYGPYQYSPEFKDWHWDNFHRSIFVDKKLVTNRDIFEWKKYGNFSEGFGLKVPKNILKEKTKWSLPASFLKRNEMRRYCAFRGRQVLQAHVFDAATFYPLNEKAKNTKRVFRTPFPWTVKRNKSFLFKAQKYEDFKLEKKHCHKVFTKECFNMTSLHKYFEESVSWVGMFQVLGGYFEYLENGHLPKENLKVSSFYFNSDSSFHSLGLRTYWDGEGFLKNNLGLGNIIQTDNSNKFEIGFRCYKEVYVKN